MIYRKSNFGHRENSGGHRECPGTTGRVSGVHRMGPPIPEGPVSCKGKGASPWWAGAPTWAPLHAPRVETLGGGGAPYALGGKFPPSGRRPSRRLHLLGPAPP